MVLQGRQIAARESRLVPTAEIAEDEESLVASSAFSDSGSERAGF